MGRSRYNLRASIMSRSSSGSESYVIIHLVCYILYSCIHLVALTCSSPCVTVIGLDVAYLNPFFVAISEESVDDDFAESGAIKRCRCIIRRNSQSLHRRVKLVLTVSLGKGRAFIGL